MLLSRNGYQLSSAPADIKLSLSLGFVFNATESTRVTPDTEQYNNNYNG